MRYRWQRHRRNGVAKSWQHPNLDIAGGDHVAVVLQTDVPGRVFPEARMRLELAARHLRVPIAAAELVLEQLEAVEPMLDVIAVHDEAGRVPCAAGVYVSGWRWIQIVGRARGRHRR